MEGWPNNQLQFYDKWVMREVDGSLLSNGFPYVTMPYTRERMLKGWTIPVSCCWNGIASLAAEPFMQGLHFRCEGALSIASPQIRLLEQ